jgi:hypothetical protein
MSEVSSVERFKRGPKSEYDTLWGLTDYDRKSIHVRKGIGQARYEVFFHEGVHAVCDENRQNAILSELRDDEEAITLLSKFMVSYLRQTRDKFYK